MIKNISILALLVLLLSACKNDAKLTLVGSSGKINHILIVIKNSDWEGDVGDALRDIITTPVDGLPQEEYQFSINQIPPQTFNGLFKRNRNIMFIGYDSISNFYANTNIYAAPQTTLTILGKDKKDLIDNINSHKTDLITTFKENDLATYQKKITREFHKINQIETFNKSGFSMKLPLTYNMVEDDGDFLWYRNDASKGLLNIVAYPIIIPLNYKINLENIINIRDSIGKKYIPGQYDNSYMSTEKRIAPITKDVTISGKKAKEIRGLWLLENDFMGGPFLSYAFVDKPNSQLIIVEGFSYSPSSKKRDIVFELEAILKTISFD